MEKKFKLVAASFVAAIVFTANVNAGMSIRCDRISTGGVICCAYDGETVTCRYTSPGQGT